MRRVRLLVLAATVASVAALGVAAPSASACSGEVCDGICDWWNANHPAPKVLPYDCPIR
jgi:hypothetical protein